MSVKPGKEFNIVGTPSEELKRHLLYLATIDSGSILSGYATTDGLRPGTEGKDADETDAFMSFAHMVMASQERIDALNDRLDKLEQASYAALIEIEEQLELAREELKNIREKAHKVTLPDGTVINVYRDGAVRLNPFQHRS